MAIAGCSGAEPKIVVGYLGDCNGSEPGAECRKI